MRFRQATFAYDNQSIVLLPNKSNSHEAVFIDFKMESTADGERITLYLHPKKDLVLQELVLEFETQADGQATFGFACAHAMFQAGHKIDFIASLNERTGYTQFEHDAPNGLLRVRKALKGMHLAHSFPAMDLLLTSGMEQVVFERYARAAELSRPVFSKKDMGWSTDGLAAEQLTESTLQKNIALIGKEGLSFSHIEIGQGWASAIGDWLKPKPFLPSGFAQLIHATRSNGLQAGLWIAPFVAAPDSDLFKQQPGWFLRDSKDALVKAPSPQGSLYVLDLYKKEVKDYIAGVFHLIFEKWGFDFVTVDYLSVARLHPPLNKNEGIVMHEALEFLRQLAGDRKLIGRMVPQGSAIGMLDFVRVCAVQPAPKQSWWSALFGRKKANALDYLQPVLKQTPLFFGAETGSIRLDNADLQVPQSILVLAALTADLLFVSGDLSALHPEAMSDLQDALDLRGSRIAQIMEPVAGVYAIKFAQEQRHQTAYTNFTPKPQTLALKKGDLLELWPYETLVLGE